MNAGPSGWRQFLVENSLEHSVSFGSGFFVGGSSCVAVGVVGSWIDNVVNVGVGHVEPAGGFFGLSVVVGAWWNVEGCMSRGGVGRNSTSLMGVGEVEAREVSFPFVLADFLVALVI